MDPYFIGEEQRVERKVYVDNEKGTFSLVFSPSFLIFVIMSLLSSSVVVPFSQVIVI